MKICVALMAAVFGIGLASCATSKSATGGTIELFNGKNLDAWRHVSADPAVPRAEIWSVRDGMLVCQGTPLGFLYTDREFTNFKLEVEYRWQPDGTPGNSGVFSRIQGFDKPLPPCVEVQLMHGNAGDVLTLQGLPLSTNQPRSFFIAEHPMGGDIAGVGKSEAAEAPAGEWNRLEVEATGSRYLVRLNGKEVNAVGDVTVASGPIGLQAEGGEIHFRRVAITPMP